MFALLSTLNFQSSKLTAAPYAVTAGHVTSTGLAGTYGSAVTFSNSANSFTGTFNGESKAGAATLGQEFGNRRIKTQRGGAETIDIERAQIG